MSNSFHQFGGGMGHGGLGTIGHVGIGILGCVQGWGGSG